ncbi:alpha/beta fold hydrolase [Bdellovibrio sp. NC01]|uniref:alpha/beta fold hydrolase n=1 Tax=Bdellovibrio sp. NC01 TaxID=2220073 RepID=UPI0011594E7C|nr:alpha/beta hydrolase [Bdellovibrio sp. NC01]QDK36182.1 hypothetical protein DOE51_00460 [Bdellovibrio sp. NC01]
MPFAQQSGVNIYFETYGSGTPVVLLHPFSTNRYFWSRQIFTLAQKHRVIVIDLRGHGLSDKPASGYSIPKLALDVEAVLKAVGDEKAVVVGVSVGGMIAMQLALQSPQYVKALVLISCGTNLAPYVPAVALQAYQERFEAAFGFMLQGSLSERTKTEKPEIFEYLNSVFRTQDNFTKESYLASLRDSEGIFNWNILDSLKEIQVPTFVFAGASDQAVPLEAVRTLSHAIPHASFKIVPDVGHYYPLEQADQFNRDLVSILETPEI